MRTNHPFHTVPPLSGGKPHLINRGKQYSMSGRMSVQTKIFIVTILGFHRYSPRHRLHTYEARI